MSDQDAVPDPDADPVPDPDSDSAPDSLDMRVVSGEPDPDELAALTAVLSLLIARRQAEEHRARRPRRAGWDRRRYGHGPAGSWRS
ncbi:acyl-CoA carboxylase subunit epsilon [Streptomyces sp. NBC_01304]|uniref:acyl-CoA carboxylase subunit epsilon n=1 Tax=Streptomyces sp. NBC_01304 TaxID=2903818 RepID=UPI002E0DE957|nr:acyl-CoA carboxylase subunit epsilon [Streptomyces sp. NBC_01304]